PRALVCILLFSSLLIILDPFWNFLQKYALKNDLRAACILHNSGDLCHKESQGRETFYQLRIREPEKRYFTPPR
ncbi:MAG: hypothetical protein J5974_04250, partial [Pyramidobacter sp.]|nr:hypothetical protein [Pyramidobacter sp.]